MPGGARSRRDDADRVADQLQHADDAADGAAGTLALDAQNLLGDLGGDGPAMASIGTILGKESRKAAVAIGVIPRLDGTGGKLHIGAVGLLLKPGGRFLEVAATIAVLEPRTDERTKNAEPPKGDLFFFVVSHEPVAGSSNLRPLHAQPVLGSNVKFRLPVTDEVANRVLALPFFNQMKEAEVEEVCSVLLESLMEVRGRST